MNRDNQNLSLLNVAQVDVKDSFLLKAELEAIELEISKAFGRGPPIMKKEPDIITESYRKLHNSDGR